MLKTKKQLLGFVGLLLVAIMTAIAYAIPVPSAAAANEGTTESASTDVEVQVQVLPNPDQPSISLNSPRDGLVTNDGMIAVRAAYSQVKSLTYTLMYRSNTGNVQVYTKTRSVSGGSGIDDFSINLEEDLTNLPSEDPFGTYEITVQATATDGTILPADHATFQFVAITTNLKDYTAENSDPILGVSTNEGVDHIRVQLYNSKGEPMFVDAAGNEEPVMVPRADIDAATGEVLITLPFAKYGIKPGDYQAVVSAYNKNGRMIGMTVTDIKFTAIPVNPEDPNAPDTPETPPNTGSTLFSDLNISRMDYLITGLFMFGAVAGFGLYLVHRKSRN